MYCWAALKLILCASSTVQSELRFAPSKANPVEAFISTLGDVISSSPSASISN